MAAGFRQRTSAGGGFEAYRRNGEFALLERRKYRHIGAWWYLHHKRLVLTILLEILFQPASQPAGVSTHNSIDGGVVIGFALKDGSADVLLVDLVVLPQQR